MNGPNDCLMPKLFKLGRSFKILVHFNGVNQNPSIYSIFYSSWLKNSYERSLQTLWIREDWVRSRVVTVFLDKQEEESQNFGVNISDSTLTYIFYWLILQLLLKGCLYSQTRKNQTEINNEWRKIKRTLHA